MLKKVSDLTGPALDYAVALAEGCVYGLPGTIHAFSPSTKWAQGGPIIEREGIDIQQVFCYMEGSFAAQCGWQAVRYTYGGPINPPKQIANTPLIAAMRCYVASKLGDMAKIPD